MPCKITNKTTWSTELGPGLLLHRNLVLKDQKERIQKEQRTQVARWESVNEQYILVYSRPTICFSDCIRMSPFSLVIRIKD